jgi:hypothetical protein
MSNEKYTFLPWLKKGLSAKITEHENTDITLQPDMRASLQASVYLNSEDNPSVSKTFSLHGPGDVRRLSQSAILRTDPLSGIQNFEFNYLPYIEFYDEDLPWRYTPAVADDATETSKARLSPWICLIALKEDEFTINTDTPGKPFIVLSSAANPVDIFPPHDQLWAWAHVQVNKEYTGTTADVKTALLNDIEADPNLAISRILCPRALVANTKYTCFLIPTFKTGFQTAMGEDPTGTKSLKKAWPDDGYPTEIPFYHSWDFKTDSLSDFEQLANLIKPVAVPAEDIGRDMYIGDPGMGMNDIVLPEGLEVIKLEGALMPPVDNMPPSITSVTNGDGTKPYQPYIDQMAELVNLTGSGTSGAALPFGESFDPGVLPPLYGQWHAKSNTVDSTNDNWKNELNLDPRHRAIAAVGTRIVKENQEEFMEQAWEQVEQIQQANQRIRQAELAARVGQALFEKHIVHPKEDLNDPVVQSRMLRLTSGAHHTIRIGGLDSITVKKHLTDSKIPDALLTPAFRKISRPTKKYNKTLAAHRGGPLTTDLIARINNGVARGIEDYPLYPKMLAPADAVPTEVILETSAVVEKRMWIKSNQLGTTFDKIPQANAEAEPASFTNAMKNVSNYATAKTPASKSVASITNANNRILNTLAPMSAVLSKLQTNVEVWSDADNAFVPVAAIEPIMAYPVIDQPVYELLKGISPDYIIPNLHKLPENSATIMQVNSRFLESLFVGLNHEMSRELLWREFPTDQRGSYMRMFWDKSDSIAATAENPQYDVTEELHLWNGRLGENIESEAEYLVLVVRGKLLEKFPDTLIFAQQAEFVGTPDPDNLANAQRKMKTDGQSKFPAFTAKLGTDVTLVGFEMSKQEALGWNGSNQFTVDNAGYFFALQERPGQLRFGADVSGTVQGMVTWDDLSWTAMNNPSIINTNIPFTGNPISFNDTIAMDQWGKSSAEMAYFLTQKPILFLIHSKDMML